MYNNIRLNGGTGLIQTAQNLTEREAFYKFFNNKKSLERFRRGASGLTYLVRTKEDATPVYNVVYINNNYIKTTIPVKQILLKLTIINSKDTNIKFGDKDINTVTQDEFDKEIKIQKEIFNSSNDYGQPICPSIIYSSTTNDDKDKLYIMNIIKDTYPELYQSIVRKKYIVGLIAMELMEGYTELIDVLINLVNAYKEIHYKTDKTDKNKYSIANQKKKEIKDTVTKLITGYIYHFCKLLSKYGYFHNDMHMRNIMVNLNDTKPPFPWFNSFIIIDFGRSIKNDKIIKNTDSFSIEQAFNGGLLKGFHINLLYDYVKNHGININRINDKRYSETVNHKLLDANDWVYRYVNFYFIALLHDTHIFNECLTRFENQDDIYFKLIMNIYKMIPEYISNTETIKSYLKKFHEEDETYITEFKKQNTPKNIEQAKSNLNSNNNEKINPKITQILQNDNTSIDIIMERLTSFHSDPNINTEINNKIPNTIKQLRIKVYFIVEPAENSSTTKLINNNNYLKCITQPDFEQINLQYTSLESINTVNVDKIYAKIYHTFVYEQNDPFFVPLTKEILQFITSIYTKMISHFKIGIVIMESLTNYVTLDVMFNKIVENTLNKNSTMLIKQRNVLACGYFTQYIYGYIFTHCMMLFHYKHYYNSFNIRDILVDYDTLNHTLQNNSDKLVFSNSIRSPFILTNFLYVKQIDTGENYTIETAFNGGLLNGLIKSNPSTYTFSSKLTLKELETINHKKISDDEIQWFNENVVAYAYNSEILNKRIEIIKPLLKWTEPSIFFYEKITKMLNPTSVISNITEMHKNTTPTLNKGGFSKRKYTFKNKKNHKLSK